MRKFLTLLFAGALAIGVVACGDDDGDDAQPADEVDTTVVDEENGDDDGNGNGTDDGDVSADAVDFCGFVQQYDDEVDEELLSQEEWAAIIAASPPELRSDIETVAEFSLQYGNLFSEDISPEEFDALDISEEAFTEIFDAGARLDAWVDANC